MATRNNRQAVRNGGSGIPGWGLFLGGVVVGLIVMALAYRNIPSLRRATQPPANAKAVAMQGRSRGSAPASASTGASQFDFYKVLPEKEVVIPNSELSAMANVEQQKAAAANNPSAPASTQALASAAAAPTGGSYVLQVGAFPKSGDANAMKAKLALQGFTAQVQPVTLDGQVWNRVRIGPFASAVKLQSVQKQLAAAGIHAIPLKEK